MQWMPHGRCTQSLGGQTPTLARNQQAGKTKMAIAGSRKMVKSNNEGFTPNLGSMYHRKG
jgi:hypothetical protein